MGSLTPLLHFNFIRVYDNMRLYYVNIQHICNIKIVCLYNIVYVDYA